MKRTYLLILLLTLATISNAQLVKTLSKTSPLKTADWGTQPSSYVDGYLDMARVELSKTFSKKLVDSIVNNSWPSGYPVKWKNIDKGEVKVYKIGDFNNNFRGSFHGVITVLWVPYAENKTLWEGDFHLQPYDFFVFLPKEAVTIKE